MTDIWIYTILSVLAISLISLAGALVISSREKILSKLVVYLVALSIGALFGDVFIHIIPEISLSATSFEQASYLILVGILLFFVIEKFLHWRHSHHCEEPGCEIHHPKPLGKIILFGDGLHNFVDGVIIASSYIISLPLGLATTMAVALHEIPQEIGDFGVLIYSGYTRKKALWYNFASAVTAILGAVLALLFSVSELFIVDWILPLAAGGFIYIAGSDLIPELHSDGRGVKALRQFLLIALGILLMYLLTFIES